MNTVITEDGTMLVLSRKPSEVILIGDSIRIVVVKIDRNQVRIGIEAPKDMIVVREELMPPDNEDGAA
jgi:carbon storage regulator